MTTRRSFVLCLAIVFVCSHAASAQQPRRGARARSAARPNAPASSPANSARAPRTAWSIITQTSGEDSETTTLVSLQPMPTAADVGAQPPLNLGVNFAYADNTPANFKSVTLTFFSRAKTCRFPAEPAIMFNLDNRPLSLPFRPQAKGADGVHMVERDDEGGDCAESVIAFVSPATLARIAAARSVRGSIDKEAFQLSANNLAALRAMLAQLKLPQLNSAQPARQRPRR